MPSRTLHVFKRFGIPASICVLLLCSCYPSTAQITSGQLRLTPAEISNIKTAPSNAPVTEILIAGNPALRGLYTILLKVKAQTTIAAHLNPDARMAIVIAGDWFFGYGDTFDKKKLKKLPALRIYAEVKPKSFCDDRIQARNSRNKRVRAFRGCLRTGS